MPKVNARKRVRKIAPSPDPSLAEAGPSTSARAPARISAKPPKRPPPTVEPRDFVDNNDNEVSSPPGSPRSKAFALQLKKFKSEYNLTDEDLVGFPADFILLPFVAPTSSFTEDNASADTTATSFEEGPVDVPYGPITASPGQSPIKKHIQQYEYAESSSQTSGPHTYGPITASPRSSPPSFSMKSLEVSLDRDVAPAEPVRIYDYGRSWSPTVCCWEYDPDKDGFTLLTEDESRKSSDKAGPKFTKVAQGDEEMDDIDID